MTVCEKRVAEQRKRHWRERQRDIVRRAELTRRAVDPALSVGIAAADAEPQLHDRAALRVRAAGRARRERDVRSAVSPIVHFDAKADERHERHRRLPHHDRPPASSDSDAVRGSSHSATCSDGEPVLARHGRRRRRDELSDRENQERRKRCMGSRDDVGRVPCRNAQRSRPRGEAQRRSPLASSPRHAASARRSVERAMDRPPGSAPRERHRAPRRRCGPSRNASISASRSTRPARAVLMRNAVGFISASRPRLMIPESRR